MSKARKFDFTQGIRSLMKTRHPSRKLNPMTLNLLNVILNDVSGRMIEQFNTEYDAYPKSAKSDKPCHQFAQKAVEKTFMGKLKKHAVYESARQLALFDTGSLRYNPEVEIEYLRTVEKETRTKIKESTPPPPPESFLQSAVAKMCPSSHTLRKDGKEFLSDQLQRFATRVVAEIQCGENEMQPRDIRQVLPQFLGPNVLKIAVSEGNRSLALHANDSLPFEPKLPPVKPRAVETMTAPEIQEPGIFKTGLRKFLLEYDKDATLDKRAIEFIDRTLYKIAEFLAMYSLEVSQAKGKLDICDMDVKECVRNEFSGMLKKHALMTGIQEVEAYFQGLLKFKPSDMTAAAKKRKESMERPVKRRKTITHAVQTGESDNSGSNLMDFLEDSEYLDNMLVEITKSEFYSSFKKSLVDIFSYKKLTVSRTLHIVCYGLGRFSSSFRSLYQLGFLILLKKEWNPDEVFIYDPLFSEPEISFLKKLDFNVLEVNERAERTATCDTIFYMPFCGMHLYDNLLSANWSVEKLNNVIIIGNSFSGGESFFNFQEKHYKIFQAGLKSAYFLYRSNDFVTEVPVKNSFKNADFFHEHHIHFFMWNHLLCVSDEVWNGIDKSRYAVVPYHLRV